MSKSKNKTKTPPVKKRKYTLPAEYLELVADRVVSTNPTKEIVFNTLCGVWNKGREDGYFSRMDEATRFRDKREATIKEMFDFLQDKISDEIHGGVVSPKEKSNNQKDK